MTDPFDLARFVEAQSRIYPVALAELEVGEKRSHWMWFIFPQLRGLGASATAHRYGIGSLAEAGAYLGHGLLGPRLLACTRAVLAAEVRSLPAIFGPVDAAKFRSSMTLFDRAAESKTVFRQALDRRCEGGADPRTLELLDSAG